MPWDDGLNDKQKDAIDSETRNVAVVAGPGTGKTKTLLRKAVQLVETEAATARQIRIANFTNAGVFDLRAKILDEDEYRDLDPKSVTTFHSLALACLLAARSSLIPQPLLVLDDWEERTFVDRFAKLRLGMRTVTDARKMREDYNSRWCIAQEDVGDWLSNRDRAAYEGVYNEARDLLGFTTRGELTFLWWRFLAGQPGASHEAMAFPWTHLLVDEYQDLNECEHEILQHLSTAGVEIFAVGDPNQAIYTGMRHAHPEFCWTFPTRVEPGVVEVLDQSYRCPKRVLEFGAALFSPPEGVPDPDFSPEDGEAHILAYPSADGEVSGSGRIVARLLQTDPEARVLIAVADKRLARGFVRELAENDLVVDDRTSKPHEGPEECRLAKALLDILREPEDSVAIATAIVLSCAPSTRDQRVVQLLEVARERSERIAALYRSEQPLPRHLETARQLVRSALGTLQTADQILRTLSELTGCEMIGDDVEEARDEISRRLTQEKQLQRGAVTIMTLHASKGMEAEYVLLPALEPGVLERDYVGAAREERRRLLYVGITRALRGLFLSYANQRAGPLRHSNPIGNSLRSGPSVFVQEVCLRTRYSAEVAGQFLERFLAE